MSMFTEGLLRAKQTQFYPYGASISIASTTHNETASSFTLHKASSRNH